jgi:hypothetical protein
MVECDKLTCHQPDRLALSVRADPGLVDASCPRSGCLRPAAIGALNRRREVLDEPSQADHAPTLPGIAAIARQVVQPGRVEEFELGQSAAERNDRARSRRP